MMLWRMLVLLTVFVVGTLPTPGWILPAPRKLHLIAGVRVARLAPDTLVMTASWSNPIDDGRGAMDSLRVRFVGIINDTSFLFRPPLPSSVTRRHVISTAAYGTGGSASYDVWAEATSYRRQQTVGPVKSVVVVIVLLDAPPPPVTGLGFTAVKRP